MDNDVTTRDPQVQLEEPERGGEIGPVIDQPAGPRPVRELQPRGAQAPDRVIVRHSEEVSELFAAMAEAQAEVGYGDIEKTKTARIKSRKEGGADYSYSYETLRDVIAATQPHLAKHGLATWQFPFPGERSVTIRTMVTHKSGQWLYNDLSALIPMPDPQAVGSGISYLRRYALKSILNVAADDEDDDGERASRPAPQETPRPAQRRSAQPQPAKAAEPPAQVGTIKELAEKSGGLLVTLSTGYRCATRSAEMADALRAHKAANRTVELRTKASPDPAKYAPILEEVLLQAAG